VGHMDQVLVHLMGVHTAVLDQDPHHIEGQDQKICHPIQGILDTWVWAQEDLRRVPDIRLLLALEAVRGDHLRELMHWEDHLVLMKEDHQDTCYHLSPAVALALLGSPLQHSHVDWVFSEPEGRVAGCPVWSLVWRESSPSRSRGVNPVHPLALAALVSSASSDLVVALAPACPLPLGVLKDWGLEDPQVHLSSHFHPSDIDHTVVRMEDNWKVVEFLKRWSGDLPEDILALVDIHCHSIHGCTYHFQSLVAQSSDHIVHAMMVEVLLGPDSCYTQVFQEALLHNPHVLEVSEMGDMKGGSLDQVAHPCLGGAEERFVDRHREDSCCSWEGNHHHWGSHLENYQ